MKILLSILLFCSCTLLAQAQRISKIQIENADVSYFEQNRLGTVVRMAGNCRFTQDNATMYCDSAVFYTDQNRLEAFGNVMIRQADGTTVTSKRLNYDGNTKKAQLFENITLTDNQAVLTTNYLDYDLSTRTGRYTSGGKIVNQNNTLTSRNATYNVNDKNAFFRGDAKVVTPEAEIKSDTLQYNTSTKIAYFFGPTTIQGDDDFIYCERGQYNTELDVGSITQNAYYLSGSRKLIGDILTYDRTKGFGTARNNVVFTDTAENVILNGDYITLIRKTETTIATGKAMLTFIIDNDSLYLHSDTLKSVLDTTTNNRTIYAFQNVRIFKNDLQAVTDSLVYTSSDSTMRCYGKPAIWTENSQMSAKQIDIVLKDKKIHEMYFFESSFIIGQEESDSTKFNQISGKDMVGYFADSKLQRLLVEGNGQSVYYAREEAGDFIGVNTAECSRMVLRFKDNKISEVNFIQQPDAIFFPMELIAEATTTLAGFNWRIIEKPINKQDIFRKPVILLEAKEE